MKKQNKNNKKNNIVEKNFGKTKHKIFILMYSMVSSCVGLTWTFRGSHWVGIFFVVPGQSKATYSEGHIKLSYIMLKIMNILLFICFCFFVFFCFFHYYVFPVLFLHVLFFLFCFAMFCSIMFCLIMET